MLTWYYYGYSRTYALIIASVQILSGILLLFRKTERIGVILFLSFMINILLINYFYEIDGAKSMSIRLTIMGFLLLFSDWEALKRYFFKTTIITSFVPKIIPSKFKKIYILKFVIIVLIAYFAYDEIATIKKDYLVKNELFGVWEITPRNTQQKINRIYIDYDNAIKIRDTSRNMFYGKVQLDENGKKISFTGKHYSDKAYYFVNDSIKKLDVKKDSIKQIRKKIRAYFNKKYNTESLEMNFKYKLNGDTLILSGNEKLKFLNITDKYVN